MKSIYFDTETTGLKPGQITQLSYIIDEPGKPLIGKNMFFKIGYMSDGAKKATGKDVGYYCNVSNGLTFKDRAEEVYRDFAGAAVVAHNLPFDEMFLSTELMRAGLRFEPSAKVDTMVYFTDILKIPYTGNWRKAGERPQYKSPKLSELSDYFMLDKGQALKFAEQLFGFSPKEVEMRQTHLDYHDARFDSIILCIISQIMRESRNPQHGNWWCNRFICK